MPQLKEVEITPRHRPTEYVRAIWWGFWAVMGVLIMAMLVFEHPRSFTDFLGDIAWNFAILVVLGLLFGALFFFIRLRYEVNKAQVIDVAQFGTYVRTPKQTIPLAPIYPETMRDAGTVQLITPSKTSTKYLSYAKATQVLMDHGIDLDEPGEPEDEPMAFEPEDILTPTQKQVLDSYEKGNHGRTTIARDTKLSEHIAQNTLTELKAKGLVK